MGSPGAVQRWGVRGAGGQLGIRQPRVSVPAPSVCIVRRDVAATGSRGVPRPSLDRPSPVGSWWTTKGGDFMSWCPGIAGWGGIFWTRRLARIVLGVRVRDTLTLDLIRCSKKV